MLIPGIILLVLGAFLLFLRSRSLSHLLEIRTAENLTVREVIDTCEAVAGSVGPGGFSQLVSVTGTLVCDHPIRGELPARECAYYVMRIDERYEEEYLETDSEGREVMRTRAGTTTVASNRSAAQFFVADGGGRLELDTDGARLDLETVVDQFQPAAGGVSALSFGNFSLDYAPVMAGGRKILGYHFFEQILPINRTVYV